MTTFRRIVRKFVFRMASRVLQSDEGRRILVEALDGLLRSPANLSFARRVNEQPYADVGRAASEDIKRPLLPPVFITSRFRSGSTLLWNVFRHLSGWTAYYEPLNERRWFDPSLRGEQVDATHRGVSDYWREYEGLQCLAEHYRSSWISRNLYMDRESSDPALRRYIQLLIEHAGGRACLQFNRIDFRLPWLRATFPDAQIVHLYRHPRDQWCSSFQRTEPFPRDGGVRDFGPHDEFYLLSWSRDLSYHFPFLNEDCVDHPYQLFYYVWKLSYLFGRAFADCSVEFEQLVAAPAAELAKLFDVLGAGHVNTDNLVGLFVQPRLGRWRGYADDAWFAEHEAKCESVLADFVQGRSSQVLPDHATID
ncbi:MAG: sulfotransferase [Planctomycetes bacterium]|nr:sulfotransferase [Planctomycetota bacterium]